MAKCPRDMEQEQPDRDPCHCTVEALGGFVPTAADGQVRPREDAVEQRRHLHPRRRYEQPAGEGAENHHEVEEPMDDGGKHARPRRTVGCGRARQDEPDGEPRDAE